MGDFRHSPGSGQERGGSVVVLPCIRAFFLASGDEDFSADGVRPDAARDELQDRGVCVFGREEGFRVFLLVDHANGFDGDPAHGAVGFVRDVSQRVERVFVHQALEGAVSLEITVQRLRRAVVATFTATRPQVIGEVALVDRVQVGERVKIEGGHCSVHEVAEAVGFHAMPLAVSIRKNESHAVAARQVS